jgi:molybdopterin-guanine dinucleotide biosynthesis protein B
MDANHDHQPHELAPLLGSVDLIITEGYKKEPYPKVEVFRPDATRDTTPVCKDDPGLIAVVSDADVTARLPIFGLDEIEAVAAFIARHFQLNDPCGMRLRS